MRILFIHCLKSIFFVLSFVGCLSASAVQLYAKPSPSIKVLSYIKCAPLKTLTQDVMQVVRQVYPSQEAEMLPLILFGAFGYPEYPGVSTTENATFFIFDDESTKELPLGGKHMVFMIKMEANSPVRQALASAGFKVHDQAGWSFVFEQTDNPYVFSSDADIELLAKINSGKMLVDIEARLFTEPMLCCPKLRERLLTGTVGYKKDNAGNFLIDEQGQTIPIKGCIAPNYEPYADSLWNELRDTDYIGLELSFENQVVKSAAFCKAKPKTALYTLFSQKVGGAVPLARFMSADHVLTSIAKYDVKATQAYLDGFFDRLAKASQPAEREGRLREFQYHVNRLNNMQNGEIVFAETYRANKNTPDSLQILGGGHEDTIVAESLNVIYSDFINNWLRKLSEKSDFPVVNTEFINNALEIEGVSVHKLVVHYKEVQGQSLMPEEQFFAVVRGNLVMATRFEEMSALIRAVQAQQPLMGNIGEVITLEKGWLAKFRFNLKTALETTIQRAYQTLPEAAVGALANRDALFAALEQIELTPITGGITLTEGQIKMSAQISVQNLVELVRLMKAIKPTTPASPENPPMIDDELSSEAAPPIAEK